MDAKRDADADTLHGSVWFARDAYRDEATRIEFRFASNRSWLFDAAVMQAERGRGRYGRILAGAAASLSAAGVTRILLCVDRRNANSARAHEKSGARTIDAVCGIRVGRLGLHRFRGRWYLRRQRVDRPLVLDLGLGESVGHA